MAWDSERRLAIKKKIDKEAARAVARLGARTVAMIVFFDEAPGGHMIMLEGGTAPFGGRELYTRLASMYALNEERMKAERPPVITEPPKPTNH